MAREQAMTMASTDRTVAQALFIKCAVATIAKSPKNRSGNLGVPVDPCRRQGSS